MPRERAVLKDSTEPVQADWPAPSRKDKEQAAPASVKVVGAVAGAIKILRFLSQSHEPLGVSKIAKGTKLNTSTTYNILRTLALNDFVHFDAHHKSYSLSLGIMEIAQAATVLRGDINSVRPQMEQVAHRHGVTLTLWQPVSTDRKVLI